MRTLRVGLIGAGYVSSYHLRALQSLKSVQIVGIADQDPGRAAKVASEFEIPSFESSRALYSANPEVIHVLTPPSTHCAVALEALEMGCHVFVEKPMAASEEECDLMIEKAAVAGRTLSVNHSAKFDPSVQRAMRLIEAGAIGNALSVEYFRSSEYPTYAGGPLPLPYRDGGYPFRDIGIHALYLMEYLLGEIRHVDVQHRGTGLDFHLAFDQWNALVQCERGTGNVQLSWTTRPLQHTLTIHTDRGTLLLDLFLGTCVVFRKFPLPKPIEALLNALSTASASVIQVCWNSVRVATGRLVRGPDIYCSIRQFYSALFHGSPPPVSAQEGKRMVGWVERIARKADGDKQRLVRFSEDRKAAPILVTGATGFIGTALVNMLLSQGKCVRLLARRQLGQATQPAIDFIAGDLGDPDVVDRAVRGSEIVYHIGAATHGSWSDYERGTIWGTKNVVESCLRHRVRRLVYVSSLSVLDYAALPLHARLDESASLEKFPEKRGNYANSKLQAEKIVMEAARNNGLSAVILRPGNVFGPGAEKVPPYGVIQIGNRWIVIGHGDALLPLIYVDDLGDALLESAEHSQALGQIIHLVDGEQITQREYLRYCQKKLPEIHIHYAPRSLLYCAAVGMQSLGALIRKSVPLTLYRLQSIKPYIEFDCTAARRLLGWVPRVGVRKGLERTFW